MYFLFLLASGVAPLAYTPCIHLLNERRLKCCMPFSTKIAVTAMVTVGFEAQAVHYRLMFLILFCFRCEGSRFRCLNICFIYLFYSYNAVCEFLQNNSLLSLIRAHEAQDAGLVAKHINMHNTLYHYIFPF